MTRVLRFPVVFLMLVVAMTACSGDTLDCDLGNEITADFDELNQGGGPPTPDDLQAIRDKIENFDAPDDIAADVETVKDNLDAFIEEMQADAPSGEKLQAAGQAIDSAGQRIEAFLADNCDAD